MKCLWVAVLISAGAFSGRAQEPDANVNERYTVESVEVKGIDQSKLDQAVRKDIEGLVGHKLNQAKLDELSRVIHKAFPGRSVSVKVGRGTVPDHVTVTFEIRGRTHHFDLTAPEAFYDSKEGWSGELDATVQVHTSTLSFGVLSDGDALLERFAGIRARYENRKIGTDRVRLAFEFDSFHQVWNGATTRAAFFSSPGAPGLYRTRQNFEPATTLVLARPLKLSVGVSFQRFQVQFPAAHTEASNAVTTTLRYDRLLEESGPNKQRLEAGYSLRAATKVLETDYVYARHTVDFRYTLWRGHHRLRDQFRSGLIAGRAPFFERFVLGNRSTLRGWNRYELAPLGADRVAHNSLEYRYRAFELFYDTGAVWSRGQDAAPRHAAGVGLHIGDLALLVAFPIRNGRAEPVFIAGLNL